MDAIKILGSLLGNNATGSKRLGGLTQGASRPSGGGGGGGMAGMLSSILGGGQGGGSDLLGAALSQMTQGGQGGSGLGGLLGGLLGGQGGAPAPAQPVPVPEPARAQVQDQAAILIRAMCNAAKVDGQIDKQEQENILGRLGEVTQEELDFVRKELSAPLDVDTFCRSVPKATAQQAYGLSVMAINLDTLKEAAYLGRLAQGLGLGANGCNQIHQQVGAPVIFS